MMTASTTDLHAGAVKVNRHLAKSQRANLEACRAVADVYEVFIQGTTVGTREHWVARERFYNWCECELGRTNWENIREIVEIGQLVPKKHFRGGRGNDVKV